MENTKDNVWNTILFPIVCLLANHRWEQKKSQPKLDLMLVLCAKKYNMLS